MRASGRRIGRIVGTLDDMRAQVRAYREAEALADRALYDRLGELETHLFLAFEAAEAIARHCNEQDKQAGWQDRG